MGLRIARFGRWEEKVWATKRFVCRRADEHRCLSRHLISGRITAFHFLSFRIFRHRWTPLIGVKPGSIDLSGCFERSRLQTTDYRPQITGCWTLLHFNSKVDVLELGRCLYLRSEDSGPMVTIWEIVGTTSFSLSVLRWGPKFECVERDLNQTSV